MNNDKLRRVLLLTMCALVFLFVLRAKTDVYREHTAVKVTPSTASKLWLSGKLEVAPVETTHTALIWMELLLLVGVYVERKPRVASAFVAPPPTITPLQQLHRFLRPPPAA